MRHTVASYTYLDVTVYKRFSTHKDLILRFTFAERAPLTETTFLNFIWVCTSDLNIQTRLVRALSTSRSTVEHNLPTELTRQNRTNTTNIVWFSASTTEIQISFFVVWNSWYIYLFRFPSNFLTSRDINPPNYRGIWACSQAAWLKKLPKMTK